MRLDDRLGDGQTQARSAAVPRPGGVAAKESLERILSDGGVHPRPMINDLDRDIARFGSTAQLDVGGARRIHHCGGVVGFT